MGPGNKCRDDSGVGRDIWLIKTPHLTKPGSRRMAEPSAGVLRSRPGSFGGAEALKDRDQQLEAIDGAGDGLAKAASLIPA